MSSDATPTEINALVASLSQLKPSPVRLARDRLLFEAGRASSHHRPWAAWSLALVLLAGTAVFLTWMLSPEPQKVHHVVYVRVPETYFLEETATMFSSSPDQSPEPQSLGQFQRSHLARAASLEALPWSHATSMDLGSRAPISLRDRNAWLRLGLP